nr:hypothetical protein [Acidobacteriota bacterium]
APEARGAHWTWPVVAVLLAAFFVGVRTLFGSGESQYYIRGAHTVSLILLAGGVALMVCWWTRQTLAAVLALGLTFAAANYVLVLVGLPYFERFKPVAPLSASALTRDPDARVIQYRVALPSMSWYLGRPIEEVLDAPVLQERFTRPGETLVLLRASDYASIQALAPTCVVARGPLFDVKLRSVIDGTAMPEMLLVSNRCER